MLGKCELINDLVTNHVNLQFGSKSLLEQRPITLHNYLKKYLGQEKFRSNCFHSEDIFLP